MGKKINITYEKLYELYIVQNKTQEQVAEECGCSAPILRKYLKKYNIVKSIKQIVETRERTCLEKLGVKNPFQSEEVKEKIEETNLKKYGHKCSLQNKDVRKKAEETNLKKYNCKNPAQNKEVKEKIKKTNIERRGVYCPFKSEEVKEKIKQTNKERLGVEYPSQKHISPDKIEIYTNKDKLVNWLNTIDYKERTSSFCSKLLDISQCVFDVYIRKYDIFNLVNHTSSEWENESKRWFEINYPDLNVQYNTKSIIKPYELDIYIPEYNLAIELNGSHWHSDKIIQRKHNMSAEEYHNMKNELCKEQGITLYTIWEIDLNEDNTLENQLEIIMNKYRYG